MVRRLTAREKCLDMQFQVHIMRQRGGRVSVCCGHSKYVIAGRCSGLGYSTSVTAVGEAAVYLLVFHARFPDWRNIVGWRAKYMDLRWHTDFHADRFRLAVEFGYPAAYFHCFPY